MKTSEKDSVPIIFEEWVQAIFANPVTKQHALHEGFTTVNGIIDARVLLKNSPGYTDWEIGQTAYQDWEEAGESYKKDLLIYKAEIDKDRSIYEHFNLIGDILDVGGGLGTIREFLSENARLVSIDPFIDAYTRITPLKKKAYTCLSKPLNFIAAHAEFIPFVSESFDYVHMRSMLDHVQVPDLALIEANRVLKTSGKLLIGLYVEGGKNGRKSMSRQFIDTAKNMLGLISLTKSKDHHTWHPTYKNLLKLISSNGFYIDDSWWQPCWNDTVVYVLARKHAIF